MKPFPLCTISYVFLSYLLMLRSENDTHSSPIHAEWLVPIRLIQIAVLSTAAS